MPRRAPIIRRATEIQATFQSANPGVAAEWRMSTDVEQDLLMAADELWRYGYGAAVLISRRDVHIDHFMGHRAYVDARLPPNSLVLEPAPA